MSNASINALWKTITSLSGMDALLFGFFVVCALGGAAVAIYVGLRAVVDFRKERSAAHPHPAALHVKRQS